MGIIQVELTNAKRVEVTMSEPAPLVLPRLDALQLNYDTREQGDLSIIEDTQSGENITRVLGGDFTYVASPPSVALTAATDADNSLMPTARIRANDDGIQTIMMLWNPDNVINGQYAINYGGSGNNIILGFIDNRWEFFVLAGQFTGDDPRTGTQMVASAGVFQTVCYTVDVDGANKQNGYLNGVLAIGPLNKTFDLTQAAARLDLGTNNQTSDLVGGFGAWLQWTVALTAAEVAQAHNFLRSIDAGYGLSEA